MSGIFQHPVRMLLQNFQALFTGRSVKHPCLTETAAADTAALNLQYNTVLRHFNIRNDRCFRIWRVRHIHLYLLFYGLRYSFLYRGKRCDRSILFICH